MTPDKKFLEINLKEPSLTPLRRQIRASIGDTLPVVAQVNAQKVSTCEIKLFFDDTVFEEVSGNPNPRSLGGGSISTELRWELHVKARAHDSDVRIEGKANGLAQLASFSVEVIVQ